jgi:acyl-ACP thioesterase
MPKCAKCGSSAAYWTIVDEENNLKEYCDDCFKKYDLAKRKKEMDEYHKRKRREESPQR